ncbi:MAG: ABC transporter permease [Blastocatellia bacterium]|nr:ABC transporter permease [Chloracidobacterium sp.]MBL8185530.1 ABC transporter permease [Blastocatellia bacterium]HBE81780.1 sugar ABC transporter permease [Blastocatellia bacterium]HRJ88797.1 ABC transporter permease [Pyrinomonadaceae bacterium]HRK48930.1 ABC transporter permease [Pyrinomonadaceae bacterium]
MSEIFTFALIFAAIRSATPLIFAALGGLFSERSGVINIALEGLMLAGAFTAAVVTFQTGNPYLGFLTGIVSGGLLAALYAVACIKFEADQVVAGMAINFLMIGLPALISGVIYDSTGSTPQIDKADQLPNYFNSISIASILAFALVPICWYVLYRTPFGLRLRATGENPAAADAAGVSVTRLRYTAVIISGILAAAGGAYLSTGQSSLFTKSMTAGRGFIALAALILAKWRPVPVLLTCLFFGFMEALTIQIQGAFKLPSGESIPVQFIEMIPYVLTIIVLAGFIGLSRAPKALGVPYRKEN